jgi:hypothetical protein
MSDIFNIMSARADNILEPAMSRLHSIAAIAAATLVLAAGPALAQTATANLQGDSVHAFVDNPHMKAFYELSRASLGPGAPPVDFPAYQQKAYAIFRAFGPSMGMTAEGMVEHLKLIPGQIAQIAKDDPHVFDSYDRFVEALVGPP